MASHPRHKPSISSIATAHLPVANLNVGTPLKSGRRMAAKTPLKSPHALASKLPPPSPAVPSKPIEEDLSRVEPDQMFARFTVPEVRALQTRLRTEGDSKQEELRLMVGERYRDLLQASTAIVSISETAQNVQSTLEDMKDSCNTSKDVRALQSGHRKAQSVMTLPGARGRQTAIPDSQLVTLQSLAAHLKLLLDTPEQLWRLLERKRFLQAAWLYLLARVVYKALTYDEDESEDHDVDWAREGIEVADQFPLIQRQWDTISSFRSQISYRASQSLRDPPPTSSPALSTPASYSSVADTLVTILLLDSLPLSETLALFLSQRSKTLQTIFSAHHPLNSSSNHSAAISKSRRKNQELAASLLRSPNPPPSRPMSPDLGGLSDFRLPPTNAPPPTNDLVDKRAAKRKRDKILKQVRDSLKRSVDIFSATLGAVRSLYGGGQEKPLIEQLLQNAVLADVPADSSAVNTPALLKLLPSSTLLVRYLPASIQSYAPFIDTTSPSSRLSLQSISSASSKWSEASLKGLQTHLATWLDDLDGVSEVWSIWMGLQGASEGGWREVLTDGEKEWLLQIVQSTCIKRVKEVWKEKLVEIEGALVREVLRCVKILRAGGKDAEADVQPSSFYFAPEFLAAVSGNDLPTDSASGLTRCKDALRQRVSGRTPLLHSALANLELQAKSLKADLAALEGPTKENAPVAEKLMKSYRPEAQASVLNMAKSLRALLNKECKSTSREDTNVAVFIGKVAAELGDDSPFIADAMVDSDDYSSFRAEMSAVHDVSLDKWRLHAIVAALEHCRRIFRTPNSLQSPSTTTPSTPSTHLSEALLVLSSSVQELGLARRSVLKKQVPRQLLESFAAAVAGEIPSEEGTVDRQVLWDLIFLSRLCAGGGSTGKREIPTLQPAIDRIRSELSNQTSPKETADYVTHVNTTVDLHMSRTGLLLGLLLPPPAKLIAGLAPPGSQKSRFGTAMTQAPPAAEKDFQLAMDIAKPSSRFGMLMVGNVDGRT